MALFGKKTEEEKKDTGAVAEAMDVATTPAPTVPVVDGHEDLFRVLAHPRITEKATRGIEHSVYVFDVAPRATKKQIKEAVAAAYNVTPVKVHVTKIAKKNMRNLRTGIKGVKGGGKKAYVYLKKGDTISIM